ncbi:MAG: coenzyme-B sulfoethylthiotransferase subunit beta [Candidatus Helarchaeota archaeon]
MKYEDKIDIYDDMGKCITEDVSIESLNPLLNPYMIKIIDYFKRTTFIDLKRLEETLRTGNVGHSVAQEKDVFMPWHARDWEIVEQAQVIGEKVKKKIQLTENDDSSVSFLPGNDVMIVQIPTNRLNKAGSRTVVSSVPGVALMQAISEVFNITPISDPDGCGILKNAVFGKYPLDNSSEWAVYTLLKPPHLIASMGLDLKSTLFNHICALTDKRTFDAIALTSILEHAAQFELGNAIGWFERYYLLGLAYQGFNGDNLLYDLISESKDGTVGDVIGNLLRFGFEDKVIVRHGRAYPSKLFSGFRLYKTKDYAKWNAYSCAGLLAATIVNTGASRAAQSVTSVFSGFSDLLSIEAGGLPDPDAGRVQGAGLGLALYTHSLLGDEGDIGSYSMDSEFLRHSAFMAPCIAAAISLDSGTTYKKPTNTSSVFFRLREVEPLFKEPMKKVAEAAKEVKL